MVSEAWPERQEGGRGCPRPGQKPGGKGWGLLKAWPERQEGVGGWFGAPCFAPRPPPGEVFLIRLLEALIGPQGRYKDLKGLYNALKCLMKPLRAFYPQEPLCALGSRQ